jgi:DNA-binding MarR family transcriptional regulator
MTTDPDPDLLSAVEATLWLARVLERTEAPLTTSQFRIMRRAAAGGERAARLAERLAVRKPTLTALADGLVGAGYLVRETDKADRRVVRLSLTAAGQQALAETERIYTAKFTELLDDAPDPDALRTLLADLEAARVARLTSSYPPSTDRLEGVARA